MLALEEAFVSMYRISRAISFRFNSKTQWQMFLLFYGRHICAPHEGHKHGVSIQSFINLSDTLLQIMRGWKTAKTWVLAMLLIHQLSIVYPRFLNRFIERSRFLVLITWLVKTENSNESCKTLLFFFCSSLQSMFQLSVQKQQYLYCPWQFLCLYLSPGLQWN